MRPHRDGSTFGEEEGEEIVGRVTVQDGEDGTKRSTGTVTRVVLGSFSLTWSRGKIWEEGVSPVPLEVYV